MLIKIVKGYDVALAISKAPAEVVSAVIQSAQVEQVSSHGQLKLGVLGGLQKTVL